MRNLTLSLIGLLVITNAFATTKQKELIEVKLKEVFVVPQGYDDNDNIEVVIDGNFPSACYDLHSTDVKIVDNTIYLKQFIRKKDISQCEKEKEMIPIHFSNIVSIGELNAGEYELKYKSSTQKVKKTFYVSRSENTNVDNFLYAPVSSAFIPELIFETDNAQVVLTGIFENSCMSLINENIEVKRFDNIFVILPKLNLRTRNCQYFARPLQQIINLGNVSEGRYLVHVRSITGRSVNKTFTVVKDQYNNYGY